MEFKEHTQAQPHQFKQRLQCVYDVCHARTKTAPCNRKCWLKMCTIVLQKAARARGSRTHAPFHWWAGHQASTSPHACLIGTQQKKSDRLFFKRNYKHRCTYSVNIEGARCTVHGRQVALRIHVPPTHVSTAPMGTAPPCAMKSSWAVRRQMAENCAALVASGTNHCCCGVTDGSPAEVLQGPTPCPPTPVHQHQSTNTSPPTPVHQHQSTTSSV